MKAGILIAASLASTFNIAVANAQPTAPFIPLDQRTFIPIPSSPWRSLVNGNYILQSGEIAPSGEAYTIDLHRPDALNQSIARIETASMNDIAQLERRDPQGFGALMKAPRWSRAQREQYEAVLSTTVASEVAQVPGLQIYRSIGDSDEGYAYINHQKVPMDVYDITSLNDLSADIENHANTLRFDCGVQSVLKIVIIQTLENQLLAPNGADSRDYKKAMGYFYANGTVSGANFLNDPITYHSFIFTPAGNVFEPTYDPTSPQLFYKMDMRQIIANSVGAYWVNANSLEQFVRGRPVLLENGTVYDAQQGSFDDHEQSRHDLDEWHNGQPAPSLMSADAIKANYAKKGYSIMDDRDRGLMVVYKRLQDGTYDIFLAQDENIGMPDEGYAFTYSGACRPDESRGPTFEIPYTDALTGETSTVAVKNLSWHEPPAAQSPAPPGLTDKFLKAAHAIVMDVGTPAQNMAQYVCTLAFG